MVLSQCSTSVITESTWLMLEDLLREPGWPRQHFGHHVGRLYAMRLGAVCHLANTPSGDRVSIDGPPQRRLSWPGTAAAGAAVWGRPIGARRLWQDIQDAFLTRLRCDHAALPGGSAGVRIPRVATDFTATAGYHNNRASPGADFTLTCFSTP